MSDPKTDPSLWLRFRGGGGRWEVYLIVILLANAIDCAVHAVKGGPSALWFGTLVAVPAFALIVRRIRPWQSDFHEYGPGTNPRRDSLIFYSMRAALGLLLIATFVVILAFSKRHPTGGELANVAVLLALFVALWLLNLRLFVKVLRLSNDQVRTALEGKRRRVVYVRDLRHLERSST